MVSKIKVYNPQKFDVGVKTLDNQVGINIKAGSFALLDENDIAYITSTSTLFERGLLRVDDEHNETLQSSGVDPVNNPNYIDDADIRKILSGSQKKIAEWLNTINEEYILERVYDIANDMDLTAGKIKVLKAKMPDRDFYE